MIVLIPHLSEINPHFYWDNPQMLALNPQLRAINPHFSLDHTHTQTLEMPELLPPAVPVPDVRVLRIPLHAPRLHVHKYYVPAMPLSSKLIRLLKGPEWHEFSPQMQQRFVEQHFTISLEADRMGYRLEGQSAISLEKPFNLLSEAVTI